LKRETLSKGIFARIAKTLTSLTALALISVTVHAAPPGYIQTNLVSNIPGLALHTDPLMLNPWGVAFFSGASPFWINENNAGVSSLIDGMGNPFPNLSSVTIPAPSSPTGGTPTGIVANTFAVFNTADGAFQIPGPNGTSFGPALFIFATEDGTIEAWNTAPIALPGIPDPSSAVIVVDKSAGGGPDGAVYKGLALDDVSGTPYLYATNFRSGKVDVFDTNFHQVQLAGSFTDPKMEHKYAPFGITNIDGNLWVTYTVQDQAKHDPVNRPNHGIIDIFDSNGNFIRRFVSHNRLNSPWAVVKTPDSFGALGGKVLVGNFGDGRIPAYDPITGDTKGYLRNTNGQMISLPGLWALTFSDAIGAVPNTLYFTAGIHHEKDGLFGSFAPEPSK
jgi:uncharacterized protein (TIGR03118 family)